MILPSTDGSAIVSREQSIHLSEKLLARRWGLSHRTLERWRHDGQGPAYLKLGGRVIYRLCDIETYEATVFHPTAATSPAPGVSVSQGSRA